MSVCLSRTLNIKNKLMQSVERNTTSRTNRIPFEQKNTTIFSAYNGTPPWDGRSNETLPMKDRSYEKPPTQDVPDGTSISNMTMQSKAPSILPQDKEASQTSVEILLQRSLEEKVISEGPDKFRYFCHPCGTEVLGTYNILCHLIGKKHVNSSFYEVMKNPLLAPRVLKDFVPKDALEATLSHQVICLSPATYQCGRCQKVLNGVKPLVQHLEFHRGDMLTMLVAAQGAVRESSGTGSDLQPQKLLKKTKVVLFEYAIDSDIRSAHVDNLIESFKLMGFELKNFLNLSSEKIDTFLELLASSDVDDAFESFIFVLTGSGNDLTFYNGTMDTIELSNVVNVIDEHSSPRFRGKDKVFIVDIHSTKSVSEMTRNRHSNILHSREEWPNSVPEKTTMIVATTAQEESILVPSLARNIKENPKMELFEMYLKICDDFNDESSDKVEYRNYKAGKFTFV